MLDLNLIKEKTEYVIGALKKKGWEVDFTELLKQMDERKAIIAEVEAIKQEKNKLSSTVPQVKKAGGDINTIFDKVKELNVSIEQLDAKLNKLEKEMNDFVATLPNLPDDDLLPGEKESNKVIYTFGEKPNSLINICSNLL